MVMGTASHVGKSLTVAGLGRWLANQGYRVAPFKSQNMSLNSTATPDGREIAWSQAMQAEACRVLPDADMNPVLLKPSGPHRSQVVLQGRRLQEVSARDYFYGDKARLWDTVQDSYFRLAAQHDVMVLEGAGSPAEMNLKARDIANMRVAHMADAAVLLVADIERGGVFGSLVGTVELLEPHERARIQGLVINKFRGDPSLFEDGTRWLTDRLQIPVWGVVPYLEDLDLEEEDSLGLDHRRYAARRGAGHGAIRVVAVRLPHLSNFMDLDPLFRDPRLSVAWADRPTEAQGADAVVIPGTKNTMDDLQWMDRRGWLDGIRRLYAGGSFVLGICGGYQMLGTSVSDPHGVESDAGVCPGLGLTRQRTTLSQEKATQQVQGVLCPPWPPAGVTAYEIHMGTTDNPDALPALVAIGGRRDGVVAAGGQLVGTYLHGLLDNAAFRHTWLERIAHARSKPLAPGDVAPDPRERRDAAYERLARHLSTHLDLGRLTELVGPPPHPTTISI